MSPVMALAVLLRARQVPFSWAKEGGGEEEESEGGFLLHEVEDDIWDVVSAMVWLVVGVVKLVKKQHVNVVGGASLLGISCLVPGREGCTVNGAATFWEGWMGWSCGIVRPFPSFEV